MPAGSNGVGVWIEEAMESDDLICGPFPGACWGRDMFGRRPKIDRARWRLHRAWLRLGTLLTRGLRRLDLLDPDEC